MESTRNDFQVGRKYSGGYTWWSDYSDQPDSQCFQCTGRTEKTVQMQELNWDGSDMGTVRRYKIQPGFSPETVFVDGHSLSASGLLPADEEIKAMEEAERVAEEARVEESKKRCAEQEQIGREIVRMLRELFPVVDGAPTVMVKYSESPFLYGFGDGELTLSVAAADRLFGLCDAAHKTGKDEVGRNGYYKTAFSVDYIQPETGEKFTYEGRQDFGDGDGGLRLGLMGTILLHPYEGMAAAYCMHSENLESAKVGDWYPCNITITESLTGYMVRKESDYCYKVDTEEQAAISTFFANMFNQKEQWERIVEEERTISVPDSAH